MKIKPDKPLKAYNNRTGLSVWTVCQVALELSKNQIGAPAIDSFEENLPRVLEALLKIEDTILDHYGEIAIDHPDS
jgi:hypothetical protein